MVCMKDDNKGQLLIIGGIIVTIFIVFSAVLTVNLSATHKPVDKTSFITPEYNNVREKFGYALNDRLSTELMGFDNVVFAIFNDTKAEFKYGELRHGYYFDAELVQIRSVDGKPEGLEVTLTLSNKKDSISDNVYYLIE